MPDRKGAKVCGILKLRGDFHVRAYIDIRGINARSAVVFGCSAVYAEYALGERYNAYRNFIIAQNIRGKLVERAVEGLGPAVGIFERYLLYPAVGKALAQICRYVHLTVLRVVCLTYHKSERLVRAVGVEEVFAVLRYVENCA